MTVTAGVTNELAEKHPELRAGIASEQVAWPIMASYSYPKDSDFKKLADRIQLGTKTVVSLFATRVFLERPREFPNCHCLFDQHTPGMFHGLSRLSANARLFIALLFLVNSHPVSAAGLLPPGHRPLPLGVHAITAEKVFVKPGESLERATIVIRDGRIETVGVDIKIPPDARVWNLTNATVYAGFLDPFVVLDEKNEAVDSSGDSPIHDHALTSGGINFYGVPGGEGDPGASGPGYELSVIHPEKRQVEGLSLSDKQEQALRDLGFTAANIVPGKGVIRGTSALINLGDEGPNQSVLKADVFQHAAFDAGTGPDKAYPKSLMGVIAAIRQTILDAQFYHRLAEENPPRRDPGLGFNPALESLAPVISGTMPVVIEPGSVLMVDRASRLADELEVDSIILASGQEWRRPDLVAATKERFIVPLNFPKSPELPDDDDWDQVSLDQLRAWDWAAENAAVLRSNELAVALTTYSLKDQKSFRKNLKLVIDRGLSEDDALAALTTNPADWCGVGDELGTIEAGKLANLTIVNGSYFDPEAKMDSVWIAGRNYPAAIPEKPKKDSDKKSEEKDEPKSTNDVRIAQSPMTGRGPLTPPRLTILRNATIWTSGPEGVITNGDLLIGDDGKILAVGHNVLSNIRLSHEPVEIDATGLDITAGLIDCHSHSFILGAVNEGTLPSTAMVRIADVVNSETERIYHQLAGGLTTANLLHGSANPIGGQNCVVKLRWGSGPEEMKFEGAIPGIKFALGENVKQSNWGDDNKSRFPQTRMGVPVFMANRFTAAQQYLAEWAAFENGTGAEPRRDLELETIGKIINGERLVHCHSYRQDEIIAFLRTMESFGVQVGTLQHILEGYKVADEIAEHGAGASTFSDWWGYKYEVIDAIPYAAAIMHDRGVVVSINSDSSDYARRLNREAAKSVKYGGVPEVEALNFVTINPAKQLRIDDRVGSLEAGKDADFAIWSGDPLSTSSICLQTWVDGRKLFDRSLEAERVRKTTEERGALLAKARKKSEKDEDKKEDDKESDAARALFFREALEHSTLFNYSCSELHSHN